MTDNTRPSVAWITAAAERATRQAWFGPLVALVVVYALFSVLVPDTFLGATNLTTMLRQTAVVGVAAIGMTVVIVQGGIDLSIGSLVALTTVVLARCLQAGMGPVSAALVAVGLAVFAGLINGLLVAKLAITPFIVTLGAMSLLRGVAKGVADEQKIDVDPSGLDALMAPLARDQAWLLVPAGVWVMLVGAALTACFLIYTRLGRYIVATGSNALTARLCGVPVRAITVLVYALAGFAAGIAGMLEFSTLTVGDPTDSLGLELEAIAAVVIGGGSLLGGQGSVLGALLGALLLTVIKTGSTHVGLPNWVQEIFTGVIIVLAMGIDRWRQERRFRSSAPREAGAAE